MNYGATKAQFLAVLNRRDITPTLTENFVKQAIQRAQRLLRVPAMEESVEITFNTSDEAVDIPGNLLQVVNVFFDDTKLTKTDIGFVRQKRQYVSNPSHYAREDGQFVIGPVPINAGVVKISYYSDFSDLSADADSNWLTDIAPDLIIYGALSFAADYYLDNRRDSFEQRFQEALMELTIQAQMDELAAGAAVTPAYSYNF